MGRSWLRVLVVAAVALAGCDDDVIGGAPDASASSPVDLAGASDLGAADGFGILCPQLAGTCVATLFDAFASCFQPAGHCFHGGHNFGAAAVWENCASYYDDHHLSPQSYPTQQYSAAGAGLCLEADVDRNTGFTHYCSGRHCDVVYSDGGTASPVIEGGAVYHPTTGLFVCEDGTTVNLGPDLGGCAPLNELLDPWNRLCDAALTQPPTCP